MFFFAPRFEGYVPVSEAGFLLFVLSSSEASPFCICILRRCCYRSRITVTKQVFQKKLLLSSAFVGFLASEAV